MKTVNKDCPCSGRDSKWHVPGTSHKRQAPAISRQQAMFISTGNRTRGYVTRVRLLVRSGAVGSSLRRVAHDVQ